MQQYYYRMITSRFVQVFLFENQHQGDTDFVYENELGSEFGTFAKCVGSCWTKKLQFASIFDVVAENVKAQPIGLTPNYHYRETCMIVLKESDTIFADNPAQNWPQFVFMILINANWAVHFHQ